MIQTKIGRSGGSTLLVVVDRRSHLSLTRQIYASIRDAVLTARLLPRTRLPSSRVLAEDLGVSRATVVLAYEQLETEGYITGRGSAGSVVNDLPIARPRHVAAEPRRADPASVDRKSRIVRAAREAIGAPQVRAAPVAFRIGEPALDLFPVRLWARLYARRARHSATALLGYGDANGYAPLRAAIAAYASAARGANATADQVILTRGAQEAMHLVARVLLHRGDPVWVEDPGYLMGRALIRAAGATITGVPVDAEGLVVGEGIQRAPNARMACVAPSHHFPLGVTMSLSRRLDLLEWANRAGAWILEDDYDSEFRYTVSPIPSLQGLDTMGRVIYVGTFSKTMFPALRLGYLLVPDSLIDVFRAARSIADHLAPGLEQATLAEFIETGHFARHTRRMRALYASRQRSLLDGVVRELGGLLDATPTETGMHVVGWLADRSIDDAAVARSAFRAGVEVAPLSRYAIRATLPPGLLMGFAAVRPGDLRTALSTLRHAIRTARRRRD